MERKVAATLIPIFGSPTILALAVLLDYVIGDPAYRAHPVRLIGGTLSWSERALPAAGMDGYAGGILLFVILAFTGVVGADRDARSDRRQWYPVDRMGSSSLSGVQPARAGRLAASRLECRAALVRDRRRRGPPGDLAARRPRHSSRMDAAACRRAAIESLSENLTDGFTSPLFWYVHRGTAGARAVQGREHDGFDGRLQDATVSALRLVSAPGSTT